MKKYTLKRNNHFVPQFYLNAWKNNAGDIFEYNKIVPSDKTRIWSKKPPSAVCYIKNFYIQKINNIETDTIERILDEYFENPSKEVLSKAINGEKLKPGDWEKIINLIAIQIFRTPSYYQKIIRILKKSFKEFGNSIPTYFYKNKVFPSLQSKEYNIDPKININFDIKAQYINKNDELFLKFSLNLNKELYLKCFTTMLDSYINILHEHKWNVIELDENVTIPTSDNPVILLNFYQNDSYNFNGGINSKGTEIIFPISPKKIIYTQIGKRKIIKKFDFQTSYMIKKFILENARNTIISSFEDSDIEKIVPRIVDLEKYKTNQRFIEYLQKNNSDE